jgi:hypothetical protein
MAARGRRVVRRNGLLPGAEQHDGKTIECGHASDQCRVVEPRSPPAAEDAMPGNMLAEIVLQSFGGGVGRT